MALSLREIVDRPVARHSFCRARANIAGREVVLLDPLSEQLDEHRWDRHAARPGLRLTGLIKGDVCFGDVQSTSTLSWQLG